MAFHLSQSGNKIHFESFSPLQSSSQLSYIEHTRPLGLESQTEGRGPCTHMPAPRKLKALLLCVLHVRLSRELDGSLHSSFTDSSVSVISVSPLPLKFWT